jgi:hypothetical protein
MLDSDVSSREAAPVGPPTPAAPVLSLEAIEHMLAERREWQVMRFRTTCIDCMPNY